VSRSLRIDVYFDFICPWCLIGKRQMEHALTRLHANQPDIGVEVFWHGVQLLPHLPAQGEPFAEFYLNRLGSVETVRMRQAQVQQAAAVAGLNIDLTRIDKMPNTADAHRLLERAVKLGSAVQCDLLLDRLFAAYFYNGEDLGCCDTLINIAESCGFDRADVADCLLGNASPYVGCVKAASSVPYFHFDRRLAMAGAQPAEVLLDAMCATLLQSDPERQPS
jgi:predicted DsbA family dithiol-disulfide isomerase